MSTPLRREFRPKLQIRARPQVFVSAICCLCGYFEQRRFPEDEVPPSPFRSPFVCHRHHTKSRFARWRDDLSVADMLQLIDLANVYQALKDEIHGRRHDHA